MENINNIALTGLFFGMIGTTIGGILGAIFNIKSNKFLSFILEFAAGLMTAVICFDLIPESLQIVDITYCITGIFIGVFSMILCNNIVNYFCNKENRIKNNNLLKTGIIISIGLAVHNFPEGLSIGAGFDASHTLGISLAIAIALHDIPERNIYFSSIKK